MTRRNLVWAMIFICTSTFASVKPAVIAFDEGESFSVSLSKSNFNRIYVVGEKITEVRFSDNSFVIDTSKNDAEYEKDGAIYLKPAIKVESNIYLSTDKGHSFSLLVKARDGSGATYHFVPTEIKTETKKEKNPNYLSFLEETMSLMLLGQETSDLSLVKLNEKSFRIKNGLELKLEKLYRGKGITGYVYKVTNSSNKKQNIAPSLFSDDRVKAMVLSARVLPPHHHAYLYSLLRNKAQSNAGAKHV